jgi:serine phosphatase RsbU (regulator of sigma subunit)
MALEDGDAVVFYSDGIPEAMNKDLEQFGEERLVSAVERTDRMDAAAARDSILGEVHDFLDGVHQQDDITLVVLRVGSSN